MPKLSQSFASAASKPHPEKPNKRHGRPFSLRLSEDERTQLERDAAGISLGRYIRWRLFTGEAPRPPKTRCRIPVKNHKAASELLAKLGQTHLAANMNQLAKATNMGTLFVTPEIEAALWQSTKDIAEMRGLLLQALGLDSAQ